MAYLLADASSDISRLMALVQQLGSEEAPRLQHLPLCTSSFYHHQNRNKADNRYFAFSPKGATCEVILYLCSPCGVFWRPTKPPKTPANSPGEQVSLSTPHRTATSVCPEQKSSSPRGSESSKALGLAGFTRSTASRRCAHTRVPRGLSSVPCTCICQEQGRAKTPAVEAGAKDCS